MQIIGDIENATLETIYWWNRTEGYYHKYFSRLDEIYLETEVFDFFVLKIFQVFLGEYSIRRNLAAGEDNVKSFVIELVKSRFVESVKKGDISIIDKLSDHFKENAATTNNRQIRSLLSKVAFLINPKDFSLLDSYAKDSLWDLTKNTKGIKRHQLNSYSCFIDHINIYLDVNGDLFSSIETILSEFDKTDAFLFFHNEPDAFRRRVFDKYLWINLAQKNGRIINNKGYKKIIGY